MIVLSSCSMLHALLNPIIYEASEMFSAFKILATLYFFWNFPSVSLVILNMVFLKLLAKLSSKWILWGINTDPGLLIEIMLFVPIWINIFRDLFPTMLFFVTSHVSISLHLPINPDIFPFKNLNDPLFDRRTTPMYTNIYWVFSSYFPIRDGKLGISFLNSFTEYHDASASVIPWKIFTNYYWVPGE